MRSSSLNLSQFILLSLLHLSYSCNRRELQGLLNNSKKGHGLDIDAPPEIHHHHHYNKDGELVHPPQPLAQPHPHPPQPLYGEGVETLTSEDDLNQAKHVVVLQPAPPPPPPIDEDLFESLFPKKFHPKHFLKHHIHKLRHRFRDLLGDKHHHHHGKHHGHGHHHHHKHSPPPPPPPQPVAYHATKVAVPALKVPLVQVEAYKPAPHHLQHHPGTKAVAYVSPGGYQPAVVIKQKPHQHYPGGEPVPPPPQEGYQYQPQPQHYHNQPQPHLHAQPAYQPQQPYHQHQHAFPPPQEGYHQHQPQSQPVYGPQAQQYQPYGPQPQQSVGANYFGQNNPSYGSFGSDTSGFADSSLFK